MVPARQTSIQVDFEKPPVVETSLGFFFAKIAGWSVLHYGSLWERFREKYPLSEFPPPVSEAPFHFEVKTDFSSPLIRACFVDQSKTQLVQVQSDLFLHNWRKAAGAADYKHYKEILPGFIQDWQLFCEFLKERSLARPNVTRCEISYFNHLVRGVDWEDLSDLSRIFPVWRGFEENSVFSGIQVAGFNVSQALPKGRITMTVQPGIRATDGKEILQLTLTVSVIPASSDDPILFACLDECHHNAVKGLLYYTSKQAQERWRRRV